MRIGSFSDELHDSACVIGVKVRRDQVVDALHARVLRGGGDAGGIAAILPAPAAIDQHRFAAGRNHERRLSAFYINEVDFQVPGRRQQCGSQQQERYPQPFHGENGSMDALEQMVFKKRIE